MKASKLTLSSFLILLGCQQPSLRSLPNQPPNHAPIQDSLSLKLANGKWKVGPLVLSRDGQIGYFNWNLAGERQIWRLVHPHGIPQQVTKGPGEFEVVKVTPDGSGILGLRHLNGRADSQFVILTLGSTDPVIWPLEEPNGLSNEVLSISSDGLNYYLASIEPRRHEMTIRMVTIGEFKSSRTLLKIRGDWRVEDSLFDNRFLLSRRHLSRGRTRTDYYFWHESQKKPTPVEIPPSIQVKELRFGRSTNMFYLLGQTVSGGESLFEYQQGNLRLVADSSSGALISFNLDQRRFRLYLERKSLAGASIETWDLAAGRKLDEAVCPGCENFHVSATSRFGRFVVFSVWPADDSKVTESRVGWPKQISYDWRDAKATEWISGSPLGQVPRALAPMRSF